jgi:hypothetical protein
MKHAIMHAPVWQTLPPSPHAAPSAADDQLEALSVG